MLSAMETAGNKEFGEDTEKKGLGTPATRAGSFCAAILCMKGKRIFTTDLLLEIVDGRANFRLEFPKRKGSK